MQASPADARHMIGGSCHMPGHPRGSQSKPSGTRANLQQGRQGTLRRSGAGHSGRKTGFLTGAAIPLDGGSISDPVLLHISLRIRVLPGPGKRPARKLIYTILVKYNCIQPPCTAWRPIMQCGKLKLDYRSHQM